MPEETADEWMIAALGELAGKYGPTTNQQITAVVYALFAVATAVDDLRRMLESERPDA